MGLIRLAIYIVVIYWAIRLFIQLKGSNHASESQFAQGKKGQRNNRDEDFTDYEEVS